MLALLLSLAAAPAPTPHPKHAWETKQLVAHLRSKLPSVIMVNRVALTVDKIRDTPIRKNFVSHGLCILAHTRPQDAATAMNPPNFHMLVRPDGSCEIDASIYRCDDEKAARKMTEHPIYRRVWEQWLFQVFSEKAARARLKETHHHQLIWGRFYIYGNPELLKEIARVLPK